MDTARFRRTLLSWLSLALGAACFTFVGWRFNVPIAAWISAILLIRFFRDQKRWYAALPAVLALAVASFIQMNGGWDMDPWMAYAFSILRPAAFLAALFCDRAFFRWLPRWAATLIYPAVYLAVDYVFALTPLGTGMSVSATQFGFPAIGQIASLTGIWGIGFLIGWLASVANTLWESRADLASVRRLAIIAGSVTLALLAYGSARYMLARPSSPTVRVGSVTIAHPRDYWAWIDQSTPRALVAGYASELSGLEEQLMAQSERAAAAGAKIIFWSEGNLVLTEDNEQSFMDRAADFARSHGIFFAPAMVVLRYGKTISDNKIVMFAPDGTRAFTYVKTISWYPTGSDGVLKTVDTPYGRIGTAICFDMDFPGFIHRLGALHADIVLVPAFDRERIRPFHTEVGLMRGLENGFSVVRQTNDGTSMAIDGSGRVLARQEFYETGDRLMLSDVPTRRVPALYPLIGESFAYAGMALALALMLWGSLVGAAGHRRNPRAAARPATVA
jgi:apolipoprotein N-acyltransferase